MTHTHGSAPPHEHEGAAPGHTHDTAPDVEHAHGPDVAAAPAGVDVHPTAGGLATRLLLSVLGAAGMIIGAFLSFFSFAEGEVPPGAGLAGIEVSNSVFYSTDDPFGATFFESAGLVAIILGVLALLGMAFRSGWLTSVAGVLGIIAFALVLITLYRVPDAGFDVSNVGIGLWVVLAGGVVALIGGFFGTRPTAVTTARY
ncbi:MAG: hypothetical protein ACRDIZ_11850 [Actinomycetota bacterium]